MYLFIYFFFLLLSGHCKLEKNVVLLAALSNLPAPPSSPPPKGYDNPDPPTQSASWTYFTI